MTPFVVWLGLLIGPGSEVVCQFKDSTTQQWKTVYVLVTGWDRFYPYSSESEGCTPAYLTSVVLRRVNYPDRECNFNKFTTVRAVIRLVPPGWPKQL